MDRTEIYGHKIETNQATCELRIDGAGVPVIQTADGYCVYYDPPQKSMEDAARSFLLTQPLAGGERKDFMQLTASELSRLARALNRLWRDGVIQSNAAMHNDNFLSGIHWGPAFMPWHRWFLRQFEVALQSIDSRITLPFWDWTRSDSRDLDSGRWKSFFGGRDNSGGEFDHWTYSRGVENGELPEMSDVEEELSANSWLRFRAIETGSHIPGHRWTGGTMATGNSPLDPLFYLHHCNLDRIWAVWQQSNPSLEQYEHLGELPSDRVPAARVPIDSPMIGGATPRSVLDLSSLPFSYPTFRVNLDGAIMYENHNGPNHAYFFKDGHYVKYKPGEGVARGLRTTGITGWKTFPGSFRNNLDAALMYENHNGPNHAYFFKGNKYVKYKPGDGLVGGIRTIGETGWNTFPDSFRSNLDAALMYENHNGPNHAYFFKGNKYIKYKPGEGLVGGIRTIGETGWTTFPDSFRSNLDAALMYENHNGPNHAYFFKGNKYIKYKPGEGLVGGIRTIGVTGWKSML